jgi:hypothetical protein
MRMIKYFNKSNIVNPFLQFNIESRDYLEKEVGEYKRIQLRVRALIFIMDYSLFYALIVLTTNFIKLFTPEIPDSITYIAVAFYAMVFIAIEYYFDGTIFKVLFKMRCMSTSFEKIKLHIFVIKFLLRPIAFVVSLIYLKFCFAILLWIFGIYKPLFKFISGEMETLWYDAYINQIVIKIPKQND